MCELSVQRYGDIARLQVYVASATLTQDLMYDTEADGHLCPAVTIASRTCLMAADLLLVGITWYKLGRGRRMVMATNMKLNGTSLAHVLLRDGKSWTLSCCGRRSFTESCTHRYNLLCVSIAPTPSRYSNVRSTDIISSLARILFVLNCLHLTFAMLSVGWTSSYLSWCEITISSTPSQLAFAFQSGSYITLFTNP